MFIPYVIVILSMTFLTFLVYSYDFAVAVGQWTHLGRPRISEYILLTLASLGGGLGACMSMKIMRHKAGKDKPHFRFVIYFSVIMNLISFTALLVTDLIGG